MSTPKTVLGSRASTSERSAWLAACSLMIVAPVGCMQEGVNRGQSWDPGAIFASANEKPEGEEWTILCVEMRDKDRVRHTETLVKGIRQVRELDSRKARLVHEDGVSRIYYGSYYRKIDTERGRDSFGPEVHDNLQFIRSLACGDSFPFAGARLVPVPTPDPGRPEWHVSRCPGTYTLHVGVFYGTSTFAEYKQAAVQWVEQLRAEGLEAWYHHGEGRSSVMIGSFGPQDVIREQVGPKSVSQNTRVRFSERVEALRNQQEFRFNLENGCKVKRIVNTPEGPKPIYQESFLIPVPQSGQAHKGPDRSAAPWADRPMDAGKTR